jgi:hypothetical protein
MVPVEKALLVTEKHELEAVHGDPGASVLVAPGSTSSWKITYMNLFPYSYSISKVPDVGVGS